MPAADEFYESLHQGSRSTRIELADDTLIAVINDVLHDFSFDASDISTLWLTVAPRLVVSARRTPFKAIERLHQAVLHGEPISSPVESLVHLLRDQADVLVVRINLNVELAIGGDRGVLSQMPTPPQTPLMGTNPY